MVAIDEQTEARQLALLFGRRRGGDAGERRVGGVGQRDGNRALHVRRQAGAADQSQ